MLNKFNLRIKLGILTTRHWSNNLVEVVNDNSFIGEWLINDWHLMKNSLF